MGMTLTCYLACGFAILFCIGLCLSSFSFLLKRGKALPAKALRMHLKYMEWTSFLEQGEPERNCISKGVRGRQHGHAHPSVPSASYYTYSLK